MRLPVDAWTREALQADQALLDLYRGPTLDIGIGGDPVMLLTRPRGLLGPGGQVVV